MCFRKEFTRWIRFAIRIVDFGKLGNPRGQSNLSGQRDTSERFSGNGELGGGNDIIIDDLVDVVSDDLLEIGGESEKKKAKCTWRNVRGKRKNSRRGENFNGIGLHGGK